MIRPVLCAALLLAVPTAAQGPTLTTTPSTPAPHYVIVDDSVRAMLAQRWDDVHADQHERAYCLAFVVQQAWDVTVYRVWAASPAQVISSRTTGITYRCPVGVPLATAHTHPPATCEIASDCHLGGVDAHECFPSLLDEWMLRMSGQPFALVQCDRWALVPYFPPASSPATP